MRRDEDKEKEEERSREVRGRGEGKKGEEETGRRYEYEGRRGEIEGNKGSTWKDIIEQRGCEYQLSAMSGSNLLAFAYSSKNLFCLCMSSVISIIFVK